jgi:2-C-methyl-D-erythritol 4-phosphate cytidylyltransferase
MSGAWAIVVAAGEGRRFGGPKAFSPLAGAPMIAYSLRAVGEAKGIEGIALVVHPGAPFETARAHAPAAIPLEIVAGADTRQASVRAGLDRVPSGVERVVVHDAARPLAGPELFERALDALEHAAGAVVAIPAADTLKRVSDDRVIETVEREGLWRAQTPQAFDAAVLRKAHELATEGSQGATDDAVLVERMGAHVAIVPGDERNIKITTPEDLAVAEAILAARRTEGAR